MTIIIGRRANTIHNAINTTAPAIITILSMILPKIQKIMMERLLLKWIIRTDTMTMIRRNQLRFSALNIRMMAMIVGRMYRRNETINKRCS